MSVGPVVMSVAGDTFTPSARIMSMLWDAATSSGDRATVICPQTGALLWAVRTDSTVTYLGISFGPHGLHAPFGFRLQQISAGRVLVYLREA